MKQKNFIFHISSKPQATMATASLSFSSVPPNQLQEEEDGDHDVLLDLFPDGIKTSGQMEPVHDQLRPYSDFPSHIQGPTVWGREDYEESPERWVHRFTTEEQAELSEAANRFVTEGTPLTGITKVSPASLAPAQT